LIAKQHKIAINGMCARRLHEMQSRATCAPCSGVRDERTIFVIIAS